MSAMLELAQWLTLLLISIVAVMDARAGQKIARSQHLLVVNAANDRVETIRLARAVGDEIHKISGRAEVSPAEGSKK